MLERRSTPRQQVPHLLARRALRVAHDGEFMATATLEPAVAPAVRPAPIAAPSGAAFVFWLLTAVCLVPIWAFDYLPTQDGPAHLSSALALKDYGLAGTRYHEFIDVRSEPLPNWLAHLLLAGLMYVVSPLVAEKLLVSLYLVGFAAATRYFLTGLGGAGRLLAAAALLLVFNRCFWLGFYNYCLSLVLYWFVLGYVLRRRERLDWRHALALGGLFLLAFFAHFFGFLLAAGSAAWLAVTARSRPLGRLAWILAAALPAGVLGLAFLAGTGFFASPASGRLGVASLAWLAQDGALERLQMELAAIPWQLFQPHAGGVPLVALFVVWFFAVLAARRVGLPRPADAPPAWPVALLGLGSLVLCVLVPDHLGAHLASTEHGGYLKTRLAVLPFLLWLGCLPEPRPPAVRRLLSASLAVLVLLNLVLVTLYCHRVNRDLEEYTAAVPAAGTGKALFVLTPHAPSSPVADPLLHASGYYCLGTGNVSLENYQPATNHFPLAYHAGVALGVGEFAAYPHPEEVDVLIAWDRRHEDCTPANFREAFRQGRLRVFVRR
jgi:hypothetical protein